jgi:hypothetical protein
MTIQQLTSGKRNNTDPRDVCLFGMTNFRNQMRRFGIKTDDRRRHMYIIGKTGMGKSTVMENMMLSDIYNGRGVGLVDPHGDFAEKIINFVPPERINDVVYFNPSDTNFPIGFNILEVKNEEQKHLVVGGLMGTFKKIWPDAWSSRMEYILNHTLFCLIENPGSTLMGINRLLSDKKYRKHMVNRVQDPVVKAFWLDEFAGYNDRYASEAVAPIQNKIGQFLSASVIRNMVAQVKSTVDVRHTMDSQKIFVMNLSKGRIGEDNSRLLGGMIITKIQLSAMERVDTPEHERKDFFLYVDEFQNFANPSFANILSEARKYRLSLVMAHQYVKQLDELVADAVFGNVGTMLVFRVGSADAEILAKEFTPTFTEEDIVNLPKFHTFLKLMIDGVASQPFSANTMPPIGSPTGSEEKVIRVSRERYARNRSDIEDKIRRWSEDEGADGPPGGESAGEAGVEVDLRSRSDSSDTKGRDERTPGGTEKRRADTLAEQEKKDARTKSTKKPNGDKNEKKTDSPVRDERKRDDKKQNAKYDNSKNRDERTSDGAEKRRAEVSGVRVENDNVEYVPEIDTSINKSTKKIRQLTEVTGAAGGTIVVDTVSGNNQKSEVLTNKETRIRDISLSTLVSTPLVSASTKIMPLVSLSNANSNTAPHDGMLDTVTYVPSRVEIPKNAKDPASVRHDSSLDQRDDALSSKKNKKRKSREKNRDERTPKGREKRESDTTHHSSPDDRVERILTGEAPIETHLDVDLGQSYVPDMSGIPVPSQGVLPAVRGAVLPAVKNMNLLPTDTSDEHTSPDMTRDLFGLYE